jgi:hypothetical protein
MHIDAKSEMHPVQQGGAVLEVRGRQQQSGPAILCGPLPRVREGSRLPVGQSWAAVFYGVEQEVE